MADTSYLDAGTLPPDVANPEPDPTTYDGAVYGTPDFARYIPTDVLDQIQRNDQANAWAQDQRAKIADIFGQAAQQNMDAIVQKYTGVTPTDQTSFPIDIPDTIHVPGAPPPVSNGGLFPGEGAQSGQSPIQDEGNPDLASPEAQGLSGPPSLVPQPHEIGSQIGQGILQAIQDAANKTPLVGAGATKLGDVGKPPQNAEEAISNATGVKPITGNLPQDIQNLTESITNRNIPVPGLLGVQTENPSQIANIIQNENPGAEPGGARMAKAGDEVLGAAGKAAEETGQTVTTAAPDVVAQWIQNEGIDLANPEDAKRVRNVTTLLSDPNRMASLVSNKKAAVGQAETDARAILSLQGKPTVAGPSPVQAAPPPSMEGKTPEQIAAAQAFADQLGKNEPGDISPSPAQPFFPAKTAAETLNAAGPEGVRIPLASESLPPESAAARQQIASDLLTKSGTMGPDAAKTFVQHPDAVDQILPLPEEPVTGNRPQAAAQILIDGGMGKRDAATYIKENPAAVDHLLGPEPAPEPPPAPVEPQAPQESALTRMQALQEQARAQGPIETTPPPPRETPPAPPQTLEERMAAQRAQALAQPSTAKPEPTGNGAQPPQPPVQPPTTTATPPPPPQPSGLSGAAQAQPVPLAQARAGTAMPPSFLQQPTGTPGLTANAPYTGAVGKLWSGWNNPILKSINNVQGILKQSILSTGALFHPAAEAFQLARTGASAGVSGIAKTPGALAKASTGFFSDAFARGWQAKNAATIARAEAAKMTMARVGGDITPDVQNAGNIALRSLLGAGTGAVSGALEAKATGASDEDVRNRALAGAAMGAAGGAISPTITKAIFQRMVPIAKVEGFKMLTASGVSDEVAAKRMNDTFGGQNLTALARSQNWQQFLKTTFLAPDWGESWLRNIGAPLGIGVDGGFFKSEEANAARKYWLATGVMATLTLEGLNMALNNGKTTFDNEPGRQGELDISNVAHAMGADPTKRFYADINELGPVGAPLQAAAAGFAERGSAADAAGNALKTAATSHFNVLPNTGLNAIFNKAPNGRPIVAPNTPGEQAVVPEAAAAVSGVAPIGLSNYNKPGVSTPLAAASQLSGVRISTGPTFGAGGAKADTPAKSFSGRRTQPLGTSGSTGSNFMTPRPAGRRTQKLG